MASFVFISKNDDEFEKYRNGNPDFLLSYGKMGGAPIYYLVAPIEQSITSVQSKKSCVDCVVVIDSSQMEIKKELADKDRTKINLDANDDDSIKKKTGEFLKYINAILQYARADVSTRASLGELMQKRANIEKDVEQSESMDVIMDTTIFVHWGFGELTNILKAEKELQHAINKWAEAGEDIICKFPQLKVFSLSSRRSSLFDLTRSRICVPVGLEELTKLSEKFKNVQIDEAFSYCAARHDWDILPEVKKGMVDRLDRFANSVLNSSLATKKKKELLQAVATSKKEIDGNAKNTGSETADFLAKILNKEVLNG